MNSLLILSFLAVQATASPTDAEFLEGIVASEFRKVLDHISIPEGSDVSVEAEATHSYAWLFSDAITSVLLERGYTVLSEGDWDYKLSFRVVDLGLWYRPNGRFWRDGMRRRGRISVLLRLSDRSGVVSWTGWLEGVDEDVVRRDEGNSPIRREVVGGGRKWMEGMLVLALLAGLLSLSF